MPTISSDSISTTPMVNSVGDRSTVSPPQRREAFTLIDPERFCLSGPDADINLGRITQNTALGLSAASRFAAVTGGAALKTVGRVLGPVTATASAALTTAQMRNTEKAQMERTERIHTAQQTYLSERPVDWHPLIPDLMADEYYQRSHVADKVGITGDYIAAGSAFLLMFPPVAAAGFAAGLAIKAGGEIGKQRENRGIKNVYDLAAQAVLNNISEVAIERLWYLLESQGISDDSVYRLEVWAFCKGLEKLPPSAPRDNLLSWLEEKLLQSLDGRRAEAGYAEQIDRELGVNLGAGQVTLCWASTAKQNIQRVQTPMGESGLFVPLLKARLLTALENHVELAELGHTRTAQTKILSEAVERAIAATLGDFDTASMIAARIAYRLYVDGSVHNGAVGCSDVHGYYDCHFVLDHNNIDVIRCGVFRVNSADEGAQEAFIPYMRKVSIPIGERVERVKESFELLSNTWHDTAEVAARQLPSQGIPKPLVDWYLSGQTYVESQLQLVAQQLENYNHATQAHDAPPNDREGLIKSQLPLTLGPRPTTGNVLAGRQFVGNTFFAHDVADSDSANNPAQTLRNNMLRNDMLRHNPLVRSPAPTRKPASQDELMVAVARLLNAAHEQVKMKTTLHLRAVEQASPSAFSAAELDDLLSVRQQLLRGIKHWLHDLPPSASGINPARQQWGEQCRLALEASVQKSEEQLITLIEQRIAVEHHSDTVTGDVTKKIV